MYLQVLLFVCAYLCVCVCYQCVFVVNVSVCFEYVCMTIHLFMYMILCCLYVHKHRPSLAQTYMVISEIMQNFK